VFQRLAKDEKAHLAYFESMELKTAGGMGATPADADEDVSRYVCSIVDGGIFRNLREMERLGRSKFNPESALELALQVEKDAVLYYLEASRANKKRAAREALERLVEEEKNHVVQISKRLEAVRKQQGRGEGR
jgi:rubrerythrin